SHGHENYFLSRVDYNSSSRSSLFARYAVDTAKINNPFEGGNIPLWGSDQKSNNQYFTTEQRTVASSSLINQVRFGYVRLREDSRTTDPTGAQGVPLSFYPGESRPNGLIS